MVTILSRLFAIALSALVAPSLHAQTTDGIGGWLDFKPHEGRIDADLEVFWSSDSSPAYVIRVDPSRPYAFVYDGAAELLKKPLTLRCKIRDPADYICYRESFGKQPGQRFHQRISVRRKSDLYALFMERANGAPSETLSKLEWAQTWVTEPAQQIELVRSIGAIYGSQGNLEKQQDVLAGGFHTTLGLGPNKTRVYWQERFDNLLLLGDYGQLEYPARDFGGRINGDPALRKRWDDFLTDFDLTYSTQALRTTIGEPVDTMEQLRIINQTLGRDVDGGQGQPAIPTIARPAR
jgi:hypothetical protein